MIYDLLLYAGVFFATIPVWIFLYKHVLGSMLADIYVKKIESGEIDLNYLLDDGGVFDTLSERIVLRFKQNMLAEMGQLSHQSGAASGELLNSDINDPIQMGFETAGELLKAVGMRKPPAMLQYKVAAALGNMLNNSQVAENTDNTKFWPDRP